MRRRDFLLAPTLLVACSRQKTSPTAQPVPMPSALPLGELAEAGQLARGQVATQTWSFDGGGRAFVIVPAWGKPDEKFPLLLALHGRGEAMKGPIEGVMGWPRDYALLRAIQRVCAPPLMGTDFEGFVDDARMAAHNADLAARPFGGLVVVCPYSPDVDLRKPSELRAYGTFLVDKVVARARAELPVVPGPAATGIDGVSLGGAIALRTGLTNPTVFGAVGSLQAAIGEDQVDDLVSQARAFRAKNPEGKLRLLTSKEDYFRGAISQTSAALKQAGIAHDYADVPGPHDYPFNRGPGAIEMLLWHDRMLRRA